MNRLVVLGGSSPFTVGLIDALAQAHDAEPPDASVAPMALVLVGRHAEHLAQIGAYAQARLGALGWRCSADTKAERALDGAHIVIHQNRYGGLALRAAGERLCQAHGVMADETLGAAALLTALVSRPQLERAAELIRRCCPAAVVLNLTNPLSLVTGVMARELPACIGLCELPVATVREAAAALDIAVPAGGANTGEVEWDYVGLNHRGFIVRLTHRGDDLLPRLVQRLEANAARGSGPTTIGGLDAACIAGLGALPLKYFKLLARPDTPPAPGRADFLDHLRDQIAHELQLDAHRPPPAARQRSQPWYPMAVVPMLAALGSSAPTTQLVNMRGDDGLVHEFKASVSRHGIGAPMPTAPPSAAAAQWLQRFQDHERAAQAALASGDRTSLLRALQADPIIPEGKAGALLDAMDREITHHGEIEHVQA